MMREEANGEPFFCNVDDAAANFNEERGKGERREARGEGGVRTGGRRDEPEAPASVVRYG
jgi:hypothetical protein